MTWRLPRVFFCENDDLIVSMRVKDVAPTTNIADYAAGYGVPGVYMRVRNAATGHPGCSVIPGPGRYRGRGANVLGFAHSPSACSRPASSR